MSGSMTVPIATASHEVVDDPGERIADLGVAEEVLGHDALVGNAQEQEQHRDGPAGAILARRAVHERRADVLRGQRPEHPGVGSASAGQAHQVAIRGAVETLGPAIGHGQRRPARVLHQLEHHRRVHLA